MSLLIMNMWHIHIPRYPSIVSSFFRQRERMHGDPDQLRVMQAPSEAPHMQVCVRDNVLVDVEGSTN